jgi:hypothetical protein
MAKKKDERQSYQLQLDFFEGGVEEGREVTKVEAIPMEIALLQDFVKAEKNLEWLGFFTPSSNWARETKKKVISFATTVEGKKVKASATILPSAEYGLPTTSDLDKYRAFQKILSDELIRNGKVPKHITFASAELIEAMGISRKNIENSKAYAGRFHKEIREWLMRMISTTINSEGAVWLAGKKVWATDTFHVFERVVGYGQELEDGTIADCHHVWLSDWMVENINGLYLLSIDYDLHKQLRKPIAKSLLPVLQIGFYASGGSYTKRYDDLCQHLGIKEHRHFVYIKRQLEPSFEDLRDKGFLAKWGYVENKLHKTYNITWKAGERFYEAQEILQEREEKLVEPVVKKPKRITRPKQVEAQQPEVKAEAVPEPKPEEISKTDVETKQKKQTKTKPQAPKHQSKPVPKETKGERALVEKLVAHNVSRGVAEELVALYNPEVVEEWVKAIDYTGANDKAAYLVKAIHDNWALPEKYLRYKDVIKQQERWDKQQQEEVERKAEEMERKKQEAERLDEIYDSLSPEQQEELDQEAEKRAPSFVKHKIAEGETDSAMVEMTLLSKKRDVLREWLEDGRIKVADSPD